MFYIKSLLQEHWSFFKNGIKGFIPLDDEDKINNHFQFEKNSFYTYGKVQFFISNSLIYESECELDSFWDSLADKQLILSGEDIKIDNSYFKINLQNVQSKYFKIAISEYKQLPKKVYEIPYNDFIKGMIISSYEYFNCLSLHHSTRKDNYNAQKQYFKEWENDLKPK